MASKHIYQLEQPVCLQDLTYVCAQLCHCWFCVTLPSADEPNDFLCVPLTLIFFTKTYSSVRLPCSAKSFKWADTQVFSHTSWEDRHLWDPSQRTESQKNFNRRISQKTIKVVHSCPSNLFYNVQQHTYKFSVKSEHTYICISFSLIIILIIFLL